MTNILVTGGGGYIGSVLVNELLKNGDSVVCLDRLFFGEEPLRDILSNPNFQIVRDDIRWFDPSILKGIDAVIDLAAISNDPSGELDPAKTYDINYLGRSRVARLSKEWGVKRYILASSCSLYGFQDQVLTETSNVNPLTTYAKASMKAEEDVLAISSPNFTVTVLRFATVYGYSKRMRFDIAVNAMISGLYKSPKIPVMRDGMQWRPFIHVLDVAKAYQLTLGHPEEKINGQIYNVGSDEQNYQIRPLAELIGSSLNVEYEIEWYGSADYRSYRVSFEKFKQSLGFEVSHTPAEGSKEIYDALVSGDLKETIKTKTVEWYKYLLECSRITNQFSVRNTIL